MARSKPANLFDTFVLFIAASSYTSIFLLVLNKFNAFWALTIATAITSIISGLLRTKIQLHLREVPIPLVLILLISLIFRWQPYLYVPGGQDQGTYVNMSVAYEKNGSTFIIDEVRKKAIESGLREFYDSANFIGRGITKRGKYEGIYLPGIYIKDLSKSEYVFQFYPLHPLWMAIVGKFAGRDNRVYSLVFFSLLSITAFYLLAREISGGNRVSSMMASLFLALNPLHAFFSKFPVTEVVALAFSSLAFFYLVRYYNHALSGETKPFYLILSSSLLGCMFFTRISGFMYMPFFYFLALITILFERNETVRRQLTLYFLSIIVLYALSVAYGMIYSYPYSHDIYQIYFSRFFHSSWQLKLTVVLIAATFLFAFILLFRTQLSKLIQSNALLTIIKYRNTIFSLALTVVMVMAFYKAYQLAFTDKFIGGRWGIGGHGWSSLNYSNAMVAICYVSPVGFAIFVYSVFRIFPTKKDITSTVFLVFLCLFWYCFTVTKFTTPYQYYYARYLLSEVVPYTLLAISLTLGLFFQTGRWWKIVSLCLSAAIAVYFVFFTLHQFKGRSADGAHSALKGIQEVVGKKDLLLLYDLRNPHRWAIQTALSYFYDINVCNLRKPSVLESKRGKIFLSQFNETFLLSQQPFRFSFLIPVRRIQYKQGEFVNSNFIPTEFGYTYGTMYLYKVAKL